MREQFAFHSIENLATISESKGYRIQLRYGSWRGGFPKWDIRTWRDEADGTETPLKGLSLSTEQIIALRDALNSIDVEAVVEGKEENENE